MHMNPNLNVWIDEILSYKRIQKKVNNFKKILLFTFKIINLILLL